MKAIQYVSEWNQNDGIGNDVLGWCEIFDSLGIENQVKTEKFTKPFPGKENIHKPLEIDYASKEDDIHLLHFGGFSFRGIDFKSFSGAKILRYHNYTPTHFFKGIDDLYVSFEKSEILTELSLASYQIYFDAIFGDSNYNLSSLYIVNDINLIKVPIQKYFLTNPAKTKNKTKLKLGYLSRFSPQKKWEDLLELFFHLHSIFPESELYCIGKIPAFLETYYLNLSKIVEKMGLSSKIHFLTSIHETDAIKSLNQLDFFISMSEHEGFGLPLLEAFGQGVPVLAYSQGATPETMQQGGILFQKKDFRSLAYLILELWNSTSMIETIRNQQYEVVNQHNLTYKSLAKTAITSYIR